MLSYNPLTDTLEDSPSPSWPLVPIGIEQGPPVKDGTTGNSSFRDGVQISWDSTSLSLFKTCPRKYKYSIIDGWQAKITPPPLAFGIYAHRIFQTWFMLTAGSTPFPKPLALERCVTLAGLLGQKLPSGDTARGKEQLVRMTVWYLDQFWDDPAETIVLPNGKPAVELSFTLPFFEIHGTHKPLQVYLSGHIDRFCRWQGRVLTADYKTTKYTLDQRFFDKWKPSIQFPLYVAAAHLIAADSQELAPVASTDGLLLDGIQLAVNFNRFSRYIVPFSPEEIEEYLQGTKWWIQLAIRASIENYFPPNEASCDQYGGCPFREICAKPPARREDYLRGHFVRRQWDPLKAR